ncbi:hyaluronan and proteoglycan link protein 1-like [Anneissia japonica]|uniref:hyaluronan and proteoglycan link protein 1-like n=1 Tax=Anneissia japonica TaxID=1529436 RepID=UPI001425B610|nr:hyaluronan and proteoglycan link protein 1-like [Anneissia japonica]
MTLVNIIFVTLVFSTTVTKAEVLSGTVKEFDFEVEIQNSALKTQVQQIFDITTEINSKMDDVKGCTCSRYHDGVFHVANGRYTYNFEEAKQACIDRGATIATPAQLQAAWEVGLDACLAGWLSDGSVRYPIRMPRQGCGINTNPGIRSWGYKPKDQKVADVYCFKR